MNERQTPIGPISEVSAKTKKLIKPAAKAIIGDKTKPLAIPQVRILSFLAKRKGATTVQIAEGSDVPYSAVSGLVFTRCRSKKNLKNPPSAALHDRKYVTRETLEIDGKSEIWYAITEAGRKALKAAK